VRRRENDLEKSRGSEGSFEFISAQKTRRWVTMPAARRLAAMLATDVAGCSRLIGKDQAGTALREHRTAAGPLVATHGGRIVMTTGDGVLIEFGSVVGAVECALAL
jgi:class 3 adenylate cyclase